MRQALGSDEECLCLLHSRQVNKDKIAFDTEIEKMLRRQAYDFRGVFFPSSISFSDIKFFKEANFSFAIFSDEVEFIKAKFLDVADFNMAKFSKKAHFFRATFFEKAFFYGAIFGDGADFSGVNFAQGANFGEAGFYGSTNFWQATEVSIKLEPILVDKKFTNCTFSDETYFSGCKIAGRISFDSIKPTIWVVDFRDIRFEPGAELQFLNSNLSLALFSGTDLRQVEFHNVNWYRRWYRNIVYEEVKIRINETAYIFYTIHKHIISMIKNVRIISEISGYLLRFAKDSKPSSYDYSRVEELYKNLKLNYEQAGDHKKSGDFHYGEMEMYRRSTPWRRGFLSWYNIYRWLSGYGEQPLLAFFWLLGFLFCLTALVQDSGIINQLGQSLGFWDTFIFILQKVTLQRPDWATPITFQGKMLSTLSVLLVPGQAALFLLALRNRLGKRH